MSLTYRNPETYRNPATYSGEGITPPPPGPSPERNGFGYIYNSPIPYDAESPYDYSGSWGSTGAPQTVLPHLSANMTLQGDGTFSFWQQGTIDEVAQCVEMICGTTVGDRTVVPRFGLPDIAFVLQQSQTDILNAVNTWEPRATVSVSITQDNQGVDTVQVNTGLRQGSV